MSQNNPPFKVVCIDDRPHFNTGQKILKKGNTYTVIKFNKKEAFQIDDSFELLETGHYGWAARRFKVIQSNYSDATAEILEKFKSPNETPDKVIVPEKVTNHL